MIYKHNHSNGIIIVRELLMSRRFLFWILSNMTVSHLQNVTPRCCMALLMCRGRREAPNRSWTSFLSFSLPSSSLACTGSRIPSRASDLHEAHHSAAFLIREIAGRTDLPFVPSDLQSWLNVGTSSLSELDVSYLSLYRAINSEIVVAVKFRWWCFFTGMIYMNFDHPIREHAQRYKFGNGSL